MNVLVVGRTGQLGLELERLGWPAGIQVEHADRSRCDLADPEMIRGLLTSSRPDVVVNAAAYTAVDRAESDSDAAELINAGGPSVLARNCVEIGAALIHISTDYVFDGTKTGPYVEDDAVNPLSVYGRTKLEGEHAVEELLPRHVIIRTSWVFSSRGNNFVKTMLRLGSQRKSLSVVTDQAGAPTSARDIAGAIGTIVKAIRADNGSWGTFHYASADPTTWFGFAQAIFAGSRQNHAVELTPITAAEFGAAARRPQNSVLDCTRILAAYGIRQPSWRAALRETLAELEMSQVQP